MSAHGGRIIMKKGPQRTIKEKFEIIQTMKNSNKPSYQFAQEVGIHPSTIRKWMKNRSKIEAWCDVKGKGNKGNWTQMQKARNTILNEVVYAWYQRSKKQGLTVTGPGIKSKALQLNEKVGDNDSFRASRGWLSRWKSQYRVRLWRSGDSVSIPPAVANKFNKTLEATIQKAHFSQDQVFNCFELTLNYKVLPRTIEPFEGFTTDEIRRNILMYRDIASVMVCSNASGTLKLPLLVVGRYKKPQGFEDTRLDELPVFYSYETNGWISDESLGEWYAARFVPRVKEFLSEQKLPLKAMLLVESAYSHFSGACFEQDDPEVTILKPDLANELQTMNRAILENLKRGYRFRLLSSILGVQEDGTRVMDIVQSINIKDAIYWIADAWDDVQSCLIQKSWEELWPTNDAIVKEEFFPDPMLSDSDLTVLARKIDSMSGLTENEISSWILHDNEKIEYLNDDEIVQIVLENNCYEEDEVVSPSAIKKPRVSGAPDPVIIPNRDMDVIFLQQVDFRDNQENEEFSIISTISPSQLQESLVFPRDTENESLARISTVNSSEFHESLDCSRDTENESLTEISTAVSPLGFHECLATPMDIEDDSLSRISTSDTSEFHESPDSSRDTKSELLMKVSTISSSEFYESLDKVITFCKENNMSPEYLRVLQQLHDNFNI